MHFNVATLLREPVGSVRRGELRDERVEVPDESYSSRVSGQVRLLRTTRGILIDATLAVRPQVECARCLTKFELPLRLHLEEEYIPLRDPITGEALPADREQFRIDDRHQLDLSEAVRQYEQAALPLRPLCREDCAGLCPHCGQNLNDGQCACAAPAAEGPWTALAGLAERLRSEESDGGP